MYSGRLPYRSPMEGHYVDQLIWAVSDPSGLPAQKFATRLPVPPIEWLEEFSQKRYGQEDLERYGVASNRTPDSELSFSLLRRPAPYRLAAWMDVLDADHSAGDWDKVMEHLAAWLIQHLNDATLLLWVVDHGGHVHLNFAKQIQTQLVKLHRLTQEKSEEELDEIHGNCPGFIPTPLARTIWGLIAAGRAGKPVAASLHNWWGRCQHEGLGLALRKEVRELLAPRLTFSRSYSWIDYETSSIDLEKPSAAESVSLDIALSSRNVHYWLEHWTPDANWTSVLRQLLGDFTVLLRDAMDMMNEIGKADEHDDLSPWDQPSIAHHSRNRRLRDWTALIELARDAWIAVADDDPEQASRVAQRWFRQPFPVFKRLCFFAAGYKNIVCRQHALEWLIAEDGWWLWSAYTRREVIRLLVAIWPTLNPEQQDTLAGVILRGPSRSMYRDQSNKRLTDDRFKRVVERAIWLRLAKIQASGASLESTALTKLGALSSRHPELHVAEDESDEFIMPESQEVSRPPLIRTPRQRRPLVAWLKENPNWIQEKDDDWSTRCQVHFPTTACALCDLAWQGKWPQDRWNSALAIWSRSDMIEKSWRWVAPLILQAPAHDVRSFAAAIGGWLREAAKIVAADDPHFMELSLRLLQLDYSLENYPLEMFQEHMNRPIGRATEAVLISWSRSRPQENQGLAPEFQKVLTPLCDPRER